MQEIVQNYWNIKEFGREVPEKLSKIKSSGDPNFEAHDLNSEIFTLYFSCLKSGDKILDIGAGGKQIEKALKLRNIKADYYSLDTAVCNKLTYNFISIDEVQGNYNLVIMQEVLEHLPLEIGIQYIKKVYSILKDNGYFVVTVPNVRRPTRFYGSDFTHIQHYPVRDLYGILRTLGFKGEVIFRGVEIRDPNQKFQQKILRFSQKILFKLMDFGFVHSILIMIQKS